MNENNMQVYDKVRTVPDNAKRAIQAGRLRGKTDINPMWRIKLLTEVYGPCGSGWYIGGVKYWTVPCEDTHELAVFCSLELFVKGEEGWSAPIYGIGGNTVIAREKNGMYLDDEAYKKSYTDAISVACKALGFGADVYWDADSTKYTQGEGLQPVQPAAMPQTAGNATVQRTQAPQPQPVWNAKAAIAEWCAANGLQTKLFSAYRSTLIAGGVVEDVPSDKMTKEHVAALCSAIQTNYLQVQ